MVYLLPYNFYVLRINLLYEVDLINTVGPSCA